MGKMLRNILTTIICSAVISAAILVVIQPASADETDLFTIKAPPNVLFILDNSNSMDEDFIGNCVCSWATGSRSVEGRRALISLINTYVNQMRMGLMTYKLPASSKYHLHNAVYFASYEPKSYCPNPPPECELYCKTENDEDRATCQTSCAAQNPLFDATYMKAMDEIFIKYGVGTEQRTRYCGLIYPKSNRYENPTDPGNYIYYKKPGALYDSSYQGNRFAYSTNYNPVEGNTQSYDGYSEKTGTSNDEVGYSSFQWSSTFSPTDEDVALGFIDFGRRLAWYYTGHTWFTNTTLNPAVGYLHIGCNDNNVINDGHKNLLLAKLDMNENDEAGYMSCTNTGDPNKCPYIVNAGLTPTAGTIQSAYDYFTGAGSYSSPITEWCQKNFIVYVTDGLPSVAEDGSDGSADALMPAVLAKIDALRSITVGGYDYDVKTYVIGLGLTTEAKTKLDTMAVHGGTAVEGHAYYADDITQLTDGLGRILQDIIEHSYSFASTSISSSRVADENYMYEASFQPTDEDPLWIGHLKKYDINEDGTVGSLIWDGGDNLRARDPGTRTIITYKGGSITDFTTANITAADLGVAIEAERNAIVGYIRGEAAYNPDNWKLGDMFHSTPITVGTPSAFFYDARDVNQAFDTYRTNPDNERTSANGKRVIVVGANDGQIRAFIAGSGEESWSFIPPNLLPKLKDLAHTSHPTGLSHQYFVDGIITVADIWFAPDADPDADGTEKSDTEWKTLMMFGEGRGGSPNLWSSSASCDSGFNPTYDAVNYPNYCGYYCFDISDTLNPYDSDFYQWRINPTAVDAPYLGDPWCRILPGRVLIEGKERWVGFMGGGFNDSVCSKVGGDTRGKGFYVIDLADGNILWSYTWADAETDGLEMHYSIPAEPAIVDTDNDSFIDTVYIGDLGSDMWRFKFCRASDGTGCTTTDWEGSVLLNSSAVGLRPIYTAPAVARDLSGNLWVYWGTGDKQNPTDANAQEVFYAVKDNDRTTTKEPADLENLTSSEDTYSGTGEGWYINLAGKGEKILSSPTVFGGVVYFTSFIPDQSGDPCAYGGDAMLSGLNHVTAAGVLTEEGDRSTLIGSGVSTAPVISLKPGTALSPDLYVTLSAGGGSGSNTIRVNFEPPTLANRTNMLFWKDYRLQ
jgi:hypothetical protein